MMLPPQHSAHMSRFLCPHFLWCFPLSHGRFPPLVREGSSLPTHTVPPPAASFVLSDKDLASAVALAPNPTAAASGSAPAPPCSPALDAFCILFYAAVSLSAPSILDATLRL